MDGLVDVTEALGVACLRVLDRTQQVSLGRGHVTRQRSDVPAQCSDLRVQVVLDQRNRIQHLLACTCGEAVKLLHDGVVACRVKVGLGFTRQIRFVVLANEFGHVCLCGLDQAEDCVRVTNFLLVNNAGVGPLSNLGSLVSFVDLPNEPLHIRIRRGVPVVDQILLGFVERNLAGVNVRTDVGFGLFFRNALDERLHFIVRRGIPVGVFE